MLELGIDFSLALAVVLFFAFLFYKTKTPGKQEKPNPGTAEAKSPQAESPTVPTAAPPAAPPVSPRAAPPAAPPVSPRAAPPAAPPVSPRAALPAAPNDSQADSQPVLLERALAQTRKQILGRLEKLFSMDRTAEFDEELENILYTSDLGPRVVDDLLQQMKSQMRSSDRHDFDKVKAFLQSLILEWISTPEASQSHALTDGQDWSSAEGPQVWMIVGVNGAGKTTSIGKLAAQAAAKGKKVMIAAGDTFRAAAGEQLKVWSERAQVQIFSTTETKDPAAVAYQAFEKAKSTGIDLLIVDTAGRLHTQAHLMEELKKIKRSLSKINSAAPHEVFLVLDANSGQNALIQAQEFNQSLGVTSIILTKMDGSAKGGITIALHRDLNIPVRFIGVGEGIQDLRPFDSKEFVLALFAQSDRQTNL